MIHRLFSFVPPLRLFAPFLTIALPLLAQVNSSNPESIEDTRTTVSTAIGRAVAVTANPLASAAVLKTLEQGGTAMDAVVVAQTVLSVVEPQSSGLGGGGFLLYWDQKEKRLHALDGRETSSAQMQADTWLTEENEPISWSIASRSLSSIGVPGTTALLWEGHRRFGNLSWSQNFDDSIKLAKNGFTPTPRFLRSISLAKKIGIKHSPAFEDLYLPNGALPLGIKPFRNQQLAKTLTRLAEGGATEFYQGEIAKELIIDIERMKTIGKTSQTITAKDLASYKVVERTPLCRRYRIWHVCSFPPPSGGGLAILQTLGMMELLLGSNKTADRSINFHFLAESLRLADADRSHWVGDPLHSPVPLEGLLEDTYLKKRSGKIQTHKSIFSPLPGMPRGGELLDLASQSRIEDGGTTHLVVVDMEGNIASYTGSVETVFGSRYISGGMVLNNQLTDFSFLPSISDKPVANRIGPNKRPMSSMSPVIVFLDGRPVMALGSPGGWLIPHYVTASLIRSFELGLSPEEVVQSKHLSVRPNQTLLEKGGDWSNPHGEIRRRLESLGHQIKDIRFSSGLALIHWFQGDWYGAADPRREGKAMSLP